MIFRKIISFSILNILLYDASNANVQNLNDEHIKQELKETISFLTNDSLLGRDTGSPEEEVVSKYLEEKFKSFGLVSYFDNSFFQPYQLNRFLTNVKKISIGGLNLENQKDGLFFYTGQENDFFLKEDNLVFVGFGIDAPNCKWNDFKDVSIKDKIVVVRGGDPGSQNNELFQGKTPSYYSFYTYKIAEAARRGAKGIFVVLDSQSQWKTYVNSYQSLFLSTNYDAKNLQYRGLVRKDIFKKILEKNGLNLDTLYSDSMAADFKPQNLNLEFSFAGKSERNIVDTKNVIATTSKDTEKFIVLTAHYDHIGHWTDPKTKTKKIFSGAIDNASSVAAMLSIAHEISKIKKELKYPIVFAGVSGEERGLFGSEYFVSHLDKKNIIANINLELTPVGEKSKGLIAIGGEYSELGNFVKKVALKHNLDYLIPIDFYGMLYRSDQFSFIRRKIPAIWLTVAPDLNFLEYILQKYHTENDTFDDSWTYESTLQIIRAILELIREIDKTDGAIKINETMPIHFPIIE